MTPGVLAHRPAVFERVEWTLTDWATARAKLAETEARMTGVLEDLGLATLVTRIDGLSPVGAAAILAETGDLPGSPPPGQWSNTPAWRHGNGCRARSPGGPRLTGAGRPGLRVAAWRAVWGCLQTNKVYAAGYRHLTGREHNKLTPTQAQTAIAGAGLRDRVMTRFLPPLPRNPSEQAALWVKSRVGSPVTTHIRATPITLIKQIR